MRKRTVSLPCDRISYRKLRGSPVRWIEKYVYHRGKYVDMWLGSVFPKDDGYYHANYDNVSQDKFKSEEKAVAFILHCHGLTGKDASYLAMKLVSE